MSSQEGTEGQLQDAEMFVEAVAKLVEEMGENRTS